MNWRAIWAIVRKDLKVVLKNKGVTIPMMLLPIILFVVLPALTVFMPALANMPGDDLAEIQSLIEQMPAGLRSGMASYDPTQQFVVYFLVFMMAPLYLIVPLMVASVIAADSFAGEKERKTLEALLYTPTTDRELLVAKSLAAWLPAVGVAWLSFMLYTVVANLANWRTMGGIFFPTTAWIALAVWVAPALALLALGVMVLVSVRAQGFQDAYQLGSLVVLPVVVLMIGQLSGVMYFSLGLVLLLGLVAWVIAAALLVYGSRTFKRGELIARL